MNPFVKSLAKLVIPAGMGSSISVAGFELEANDKGYVEVPKEHVAVLKAHGLTDYVEPAGKVGTVSSNAAR